MENIRQILKRPFNKETDKFKILANVSRLSNVDENTAREMVLRILSRKNEFSGYEDIIVSLVRSVGLYPYLDPQTLSLRDLMAYEMHRPENMEDVVLHRGQADVYYHLMNGDNVILSAPTSYGKSLVIDSVIASMKYNNIAIIVPSIALIDETRKRLSRFKSHYKIITFPSQSLSQRNIFILTQERANDFPNGFKVDFFVIDEFYKLSTPIHKDGDSRFEILNQVFYKLVKSGAKFYLLGPNIENINVGSLAEIKYIFIKTDFKTVISEKHIISVKEEDRIPRLLSILQENNCPTIVFCKSPKSANDVANALIESNKFHQNQINNELVGWIKENYHSEWIFPIAMEYGIGIHHGKIPRSLAQQCVKLFNEGNLKILICTSTLIEGVNTKAKSIIIYDHQISTHPIDYFTFNNICGRSGRMFQHFIGDVYMFKNPPAPQLPFVDIPIFTQSENVPEAILINIDEEDLSELSKSRLKTYTEQDDIPLEVLRQNSFIPLNWQLECSRYLNNNLNQLYNILKWTSIPTNNQLYAVCEIIWNYLIRTKKLVYGIKSGKQLAFTINNYRQSGSIKNFIHKTINNQYLNLNIQECIEHALDIQRHWINFQFPRYLKCLDSIVKEVFRHKNLKPGDYIYFANAVESYFQPYYVVPLEEYGIPSQISLKLADFFDDCEGLDNVLMNLKDLDVVNLNLSSIEKAFLSEAKTYL